MLFQTDWFPAIVARIFAARPVEWIFQFAERVVFLTAKMAAEPGFYRSTKTPWTRRLQYLAQHPFHNGRRIRKIVVKKCSQSGFTEAVLNCIRWFAKYAPRNVIYAINSAVEAINIRERLVETLKSPALGEEIFTGDDDDIGRLKLSLRHMIVWFFGSFTSGSFANKQAPFCVSDEAEEHAVIAGDTTTVVNLDSRLKDAEEGLHVVLSKPKLEIVKDGKVVGGVICAEHAAGNQEIYLVPCPHCGTWQEIEWSRIVYRHCKNLLGEWDFSRVLSETYLECAATHCDKPITEDHKEAMINNERSLVPPMFGWFPTAQGRPDCDPEVISQHMSDLYSLSKSVTWGRIAIKMIKARTHSARQGVYNHNLGLGYKMGAVKTEAIDILKCRAPYKRGEIPFAPVGFLLGADIGKSDAPWVVGAFNESNDLAIVDWGNEIHPDGVAEIVNFAEYPCRADLKKYKISQAALDAKHRVEDSYAACMKAPLLLWPVKGGGSTRARLAFALSAIPTYPEWLTLISFNDRDFKTELYTERIKREVPPTLSAAEAEELRKTMPRLMVPENVTNDFIVQLTNEELKEDLETGKMEWQRTGPNHWGDCVKEICVLWRYLNRERTPGGDALKEEPK
jgi:hypothetical protein